MQALQLSASLPSPKCLLPISLFLQFQIGIEGYGQFEHPLLLSMRPGGVEEVLYSSFGIRGAPGLCLRPQETGVLGFTKCLGNMFSFEMARVQNATLRYTGESVNHRKHCLDVSLPAAWASLSPPAQNDSSGLDSWGWQLTARMKPCHGGEGQRFFLSENQALCVLSSLWPDEDICASMELSKDPTFRLMFTLRREAHLRFETAFDGSTWLYHELFAWSARNSAASLLYTCFSAVLLTVGCCLLYRLEAARELFVADIPTNIGRTLNRWRKRCLCFRRASFPRLSRVEQHIQEFASGRRVGRSRKLIIICLCVLLLKLVQTIWQQIWLTQVSSQVSRTLLQVYIWSFDCWPLSLAVLFISLVSCRMVRLTTRRLDTLNVLLMLVWAFGQTPGAEIALSKTDFGFILPMRYLQCIICGNFGLSAVLQLVGSLCSFVYRQYWSAFPLPFDDVLYELLHILTMLLPIYVLDQETIAAGAQSVESLALAANLQVVDQHVAVAYDASCRLDVSFNILSGGHQLAYMLRRDEQIGSFHGLCFLDFLSDADFRRFEFSVGQLQERQPALKLHVSTKENSMCLQKELKVTAAVWRQVSGERCYLIGVAQFEQPDDRVVNLAISQPSTVQNGAAQGQTAGAPQDAVSASHSRSSKSSRSRSQSQSSEMTGLSLFANGNLPADAITFSFDGTLQLLEASASFRLLLGLGKVDNAQEVEEVLDVPLASLVEDQRDYGKLQDLMKARDLEEIEMKVMFTLPLRSDQLKSGQAQSRKHKRKQYEADLRVRPDQWNRDILRSDCCEFEANIRSLRKVEGGRLTGTPHALPPEPLPTRVGASRSRL
eukprot:TRINITY_DN98141_c0_g1_i1.p1 TRINITY_DN98141_c0_g1~~TRINITY_DN98141_c0_g1_i1.p1  ORF type:complete len:831 (+),score=79.30 TRINITY_DN98141_c0_g1_i1:160-2652(+)